MKKTYWFDPGACQYLGSVFEEVANALTNGTCPGRHMAVVIYETDNNEDPLRKSGGGAKEY